MLKKLDLSPGKIVYDDFQIKPNIPFEQQKFSFKEDLFQVDFYEKYLIDIGWSPDFESKGNFKIRIIKDYNWTHPLYFKKTNKLDTLPFFIKECVDIIRQKLAKKT